MLDKSLLFQDGKAQMFHLGQIIRKQYGLFLGNRYTPDLIEPMSSYYSRSKASLQLVLAALYPPLDDEIFVPGLNWQPIPFTHNTKESDNFFVTSANCPNFYKEVARYKKTSEYAKIYAPDREIFEFVEQHTNTTIFSYIELMGVQNSLLVEQELGLTIPEWAVSIYPKLTNLTLKGYSFQTSTENLARITAGNVIKRLINDMEQKIENTFLMSKKKLVLFSAHDATIAVLLGALKVFKLPLPQYGARIAIELHRINGTFGFKVDT